MYRMVRLERRCSTLLKLVKLQCEYRDDNDFGVPKNIFFFFFKF
jgi:hypothetical protein